MKITLREHTYICRLLVALGIVLGQSTLVWIFSSIVEYISVPSIKGVTNLAYLISWGAFPVFVALALIGKFDKHFPRLPLSIVASNEDK